MRVQRGAVPESSLQACSALRGQEILPGAAMRQALALAACLLIALAAAREGPPPGRRLLQRRLASQAPFNSAQRLGNVASPTPEQRRRREASERVAQELAERQTPDAALHTAANRTTQLLRRRAALLSEVARIDVELAKERDSRRAALTRKYEAALKALDEEESRYARPPSPADGESLRDQIAAAVGRSRGGGGGSSTGMAHQDIEHQDVDIDVILTHIDADGDGVITKAEAKSASAGATVVQFGPSALVGCLAGVVCYVLCRLCFLRSAPVGSRVHGSVAAWLHPRGAGKPPLAAAGTATKAKVSGGNEVISSTDKAARMRKRHGECGPAIAC